MTTIPPSSAGRPGAVPAAREQTVSTPKPPTPSAPIAHPGDDFNRASASPFSESALRLKAGKASHGLQPFLRHRGVSSDASPSDTALAAGTASASEGQATAASAPVRFAESGARTGSTEPLAMLLASLFTDDASFRMLVSDMSPPGQSLAHTLPGPAVSREKMARAVAEKLATHVPRDQLLARLCAEAPALRDDLIAAVAELGPAAPVDDSGNAAGGPRTAQSGLRDLLLDLFSSPELEMLIADMSVDRQLRHHLPGDEASDVAFAEAASELLLRNFSRETILNQLANERPARREQIARRIGELGELGPPPPPGEQPATPQQQALHGLLCSLFANTGDLNVFLKNIPGSQKWVDELCDGSATLDQSATVASRLLLATVAPKVLAQKLIEEAPAGRKDIVNALGVELKDEPIPPPTMQQEFNLLLCTFFTEPAELRMFLHDMGRRDLEQKIPCEDLSMMRMADATATLLLANVDPAVVRDQLVELYPRRRGDIEAFFGRLTSTG